MGPIVAKTKKEWDRVGKNIRRRRLERGWTQIHLARMAGITNVSVCNIERGRTTPSLGSVVAIARALRVNRYKLFE